MKTVGKIYKMYRNTVGQRFATIPKDVAENLNAELIRVIYNEEKDIIEIHPVRIDNELPGIQANA